jgi:hypothetical protein
MRAFFRLPATGIAVGMGVLAWAGPRDEFEPVKEPPGATVDPATWLGRLQGRYKVDGVIHHETYEENDNGVMVPYQKDPDDPEPDYLVEWTQPVATGKADCTGFSDGPGMHCLLNIDWAVGEDGDLFPPEAPVISHTAPKTEVHASPPSLKMGMGSSSLRPAMILAGMAPSAPGTVRLLLVDDKGLAHPATLAMSGDALIATPPCTNDPGKTTCAQRFRIEARPASGTVFVTFGVRTTFLQYRRPPIGAQRAARTMKHYEELLEISLSFRREAQAAPEHPRESRGDNTP